MDELNMFIFSLFIYLSDIAELIVFMVSVGRYP